MAVVDRGLINIYIVHTQSLGSISNDYSIGYVRSKTKPHLNITPFFKFYHIFINTFVFWYGIVFDRFFSAFSHLIPCWWSSRWRSRGFDIDFDTCDLFNLWFSMMRLSRRAKSWGFPCSSEQFWINLWSFFLVFELFWQLGASTTKLNPWARQRFRNVADKIRSWGNINLGQDRYLVDIRMIR